MSSPGTICRWPKYTFGVDELIFLGYVVSSKGIKPSPEKVQAILDFPKSKTAKQLRRYLGMINFYRMGMADTARMLAPLNDLLQGNVKDKAPLQLDANDHSSSRRVKKGSRANYTARAPANWRTARSRFRFLGLLSGSRWQVGARWGQQFNGNWEPLAFFSKKFSPAESRYSAFDRELLAIYLTIKNFRHMLEARVFTVYTDHKPLTYAFQQKLEKASPRQSQHLDFIGQFTTDIQHVSGKDNIVANALSRIE